MWHCCEHGEDAGVPLGICNSHAGVLILLRTTVHNCLCCSKCLMLSANSTWIITASLSPRGCPRWHDARMLQQAVCPLSTGRAECPGGHGTCTGEAMYPLGIPSAVTKELTLFMLICFFSTSSEVFRGSSYLGARTNTIIKIAKKTPKQ